MQTPTGLSSQLGTGSERDQDLELDGQRTIMRSFRQSMAQDSVGFGVHDDRGVRTMSGQGNAQPPRVGGEGRRFAVAGERMNDDDRFALQALRMVRSGNENS